LHALALDRLFCDIAPNRLILFPHSWKVAIMFAQRIRTGSLKLLSLLVPVAALTLPAAAADTSVTLSNVHLCCDNCVKGADKAIAPIAGAKDTCDKAAGTIVITAPDKETAQKAVDALVAAGFYGKSSNSTIMVAAPSGAKDEKVQSLDVSGVHLCCNKCVTSVKQVLSKVDGVKSNTVKSKATEFNVAGDFNDKKVFDDLNNAGFSGKVK
jgi:copper chaperone CopZ